MKFSLLALASMAFAAPSTLEARWDWGTCASDDQYSCSSVGLVNALNCINLLDGTTLNLGILSGLRKRNQDWYPTATPTPTPSSGSSDQPYCCVSAGLLNILNCENILDGDDITVQIL